jgi:hypothetical protein
MHVGTHGSPLSHQHVDTIDVSPVYREHGQGVGAHSVSGSLVGPEAAASGSPNPWRAHCKSYPVICSRTATGEEKVTGESKNRAGNADSLLFVPVVVWQLLVQRNCAVLAGMPAVVAFDDAQALGMILDEVLIVCSGTTAGAGARVGQMARGLGDTGRSRLPGRTDWAVHHHGRDRRRPGDITRSHCPPTRRATVPVAYSSM